MKTGPLKLALLTALLISTAAIGSETDSFASTPWTFESVASPTETSVPMVENINLFAPEPYSIKSPTDQPDPLKRALVGYLGYFAGMLLLVCHPQRP